MLGSMSMFQDLTNGEYLVDTFTFRSEPSLTVLISLFTSPSYWDKYIRCYIIQTDSFVVTTSGFLSFLINWDNQRSRPVRWDYVQFPYSNYHCWTRLLSLEISGASPFEHAALCRFRLVIAFSISLRVWALMSIFLSDCLAIVGNWRVVGGQLDCCLKCSAYRSNLMGWEWIIVLR